MITNRRAAGLLALLVAIACVAWLMAARGGLLPMAADEDLAAATGLEESDGSVRGNGGAGNRSGARPPPAPLPPMDAPLAQTLASLEQRARAGEAAAACRLAADVFRCGWLPMQRENHLGWLSQQERRMSLLARAGTPGEFDLANRKLQEELKMREDSLTKSEAQCANVATPTARDMAMRWHQAALAGSPTAMRMWVSGNATPYHSILENTEALALYRQGAEAMAWELVRGGDLLATLQLAAATAPVHSRRMSLLGQVVEQDVALSLALYQRARDALRDSEREDAAPLLARVEERLVDLEGLASEAERAEAQRHRLEQAGWTEVATKGVVLPFDARGQGAIGASAACHQEAGEDTAIRRVARRAATPI